MDLVPENVAQLVSCAPERRVFWEVMLRGVEVVRVGGGRFR